MTKFMNLFLTLKKNAVRFVNAIDNAAQRIPITMDRPMVMICVVLKRERGEIGDVRKI